MYAAQRRAWTTDHTLCNGTQMGPLTRGEGFTALTTVEEYNKCDC